MKCKVKTNGRNDALPPFFAFLIEKIVRWLKRKVVIGKAVLVRRPVVVQRSWYDCTPADVQLYAGRCVKHLLFRFSATRACDNQRFGYIGAGYDGL